MEIIVGFYVFGLIALSIILSAKKDIPLPVTYSWGAAIAFIGRVFVQATTGTRRIDLVAVLMALLVTAFAVYVSMKKDL